MSDNINILVVTAQIGQTTHKRLGFESHVDCSFQNYRCNYPKNEAGISIIVENLFIEFFKRMDPVKLKGLQDVKLLIDGDDNSPLASRVISQLREKIKEQLSGLDSPNSA